MSRTDQDWPAFLERYHQAHAGITEDLLAPMVDSTGRSPYAWLTEGLPCVGLVWDVCCGSAPVADLVGLDRYRGVDASTAELAVARARRPGVSVAAGDAHLVGPGEPVAAVTVAMALMLLDLDRFLRRLAPSLASGTPLSAIVPNRGAAAGGSDYGRLLELLGQADVGYRQPLEPATLPAAYAAAGFELVDDQTVVFSRPVRDASEVALVIASYYGLNGDPSAVDGASTWLTERSSVDGYVLDYPLRRLRARRR
ncbi:MAG: class I SAM-dependent methyltransferase [Mycobacteriales bacterium]